MENPTTVQRLRELKKEFDPEILILSETKKPPEIVDEKLDILNFVSKFHVPPHSPGGGGLSLLWNSSIKIQILYSCDNFIDTEIEYKNKSFFATFTYGAPEQANRRKVLQHLSDICESRSGPWFLTGDFNDIIDNTEKDGGPARTEGSFGQFRIFLSQCDLFDLRHSGNFLS